MPLPTPLFFISRHFFHYADIFFFFFEITDFRRFLRFFHADGFLMRYFSPLCHFLSRLHYIRHAMLISDAAFAAYFADALLRRRHFSCFSPLMPLHAIFHMLFTP